MSKATPTQPRPRIWYLLIGLFALGRYRTMATPQEMQEFFK